MSDNKSGIKEYYLGINTILPTELQVVIPEDFVINEFSINDFDEYNPETNYFNFILAKTYETKTGFIKIYTQEQSFINSKISYPDCGESALRTFINILTFNSVTGLFDINYLREYEPNNKIIEYYTVFNNDNLQSSKVPRKVFTNPEQELNARDAWSVVVSNLPGVIYNTATTDRIYSVELDRYPLGTDGYKFNIRGGVSNMGEDGIYIPNLLQVLRILFSKILNFTDFNNRNINLIVNLNKDGLGTILINKFPNKYMWSFAPRHYSISPNLNTVDLTDELGKGLTTKELYYINLLSLPIEELYKNKDIIKQVNWFYFYNYTRDNLIFLINNYNIDEKHYYIIYDYIYINFDDDQKKRIDVNLSKLYNINIYDLDNIYNSYDFMRIKYDDTGNKNHENIIEYTCFKLFDNNLDKLTNLQIITFGNNLFNQPFGNSLDKLTNLKKLKLNNKFNYPLAKSLYSLINLHTLELGVFNQPLDNSLDKLVNLKILTLGLMYNHPLANSLDKLTNLSTLNLGQSFNCPLANSLDKLINLSILNVGDKFDCLVDNSLDKLINLSTLTFGSDYRQPLHNSLYNLTNLQTLTFGHSFGIYVDFGSSLDKLINLKSLTFKNIKYGLKSSLDKLTSLQTLTFGHKTKDMKLEDSLFKLVNLQTLDITNNIESLNCSLDRLVNLETLRVYNIESLGNSLNGLTKMKTLILEGYERPLLDSLNGLINLQTLILGNKYGSDKPLSKLDNFLDSLINLQKIELYNYNHSLNNSLDNLTNLETLKITGFNKLLDNSLNNLIKLETLSFDYRFNSPLANSLDNLINLKTLSLGSFNYPFEQSLYHLTNLQELNASYRYDKPLNNYLDSLINLQKTNIPKRLLSETLLEKLK